MNTPLYVSAVTEPTLLLDEKLCKQNIKRMVDKANRHNLIFRPHFKTHQSKIVGQWFRQFGVTKITVSSLKMAEYFSEDGWNDITVAFPVNIREIERIQRLAAKIQLNLLVESLETVDFLEKNLRATINVYLKIDVGYHRTGILPENSLLIEGILDKIEKASKINFFGFLGHAGHSYQARTEQDIANIHTSSINILKKLKETYKPRFPSLINSTGDTPTCSVMDSFEGIDEIRPGNFVFYDLTQLTIGSCGKDDIAVAMACPVVAKHPDRNELLVYGGGVHFSKDRVTLNSNNQVVFGVVAHLNDEGWKMADGTKNYMSKLSQEHGTIKVEKDVFDQYQIGDVIGVLPVHICMASNLMKSHLTLTGDLIDRL